MQENALHLYSDIVTNHEADRCMFELLVMLVRENSHYWIIREEILQFLGGPINSYVFFFIYGFRFDVSNNAYQMNFVVTHIYVPLFPLDNWFVTMSGPAYKRARVTILIEIGVDFPLVIFLLRTRLWQFSLRHILKKFVLQDFPNRKKKL